VTPIAEQEIRVSWFTAK